MRKLINNKFLSFGMNESDAFALSMMATIIIYLAITVRVFIGMNEANDVGKCTASSINDVLLSPAYALGCNLAKDRFDIKLN